MAYTRTDSSGAPALHIIPAMMEDLIMMSYRMNGSIAVASIIAALLITIHTAPLSAQEGVRPSRLLMGGLIGITSNTFTGDFHSVDNSAPASSIVPDGFHGASAIVLLAGATAEFDPGGIFGAHLAVAYDNRSAGWEMSDSWQSTFGTPQPNRITTNLAYLSIEPSVVVHVGSVLSLLAGPSIGFAVAKSYQYSYQPPLRPPVTSEITETVHGTLNEARDVTYSGRLAVRADFDISPDNSALRIMLSPFAGYTLGTDLFESTSDPKNVYTVSTVRAGVEVKLGSVAGG